MNKAALKENRLHGDPDFPANVYAVTCPPEEQLLDLHWHDELEFLTVTRGRAIFRVDMRDYEVAAGETLFINSGELHSGRVAGGEPCAFMAVVFHARLLGGSAGDVVQERYIQPLLQRRCAPPVHLSGRTEAEREATALLTSLFEAYQTRQLAWEPTVKGMLYLAMAALLRQDGTVWTARGREPSGAGERLKTAIEYIERHYAEPLALGTLAGLVSMSESYFCRLFKKVTTCSPVQYINLHRVRQAALLLRSTDLKVMDVAMNVGFNNLSYFNGLFRERFGCTPAEYRRRGRA